MVNNNFFSVRFLLMMSFAVLAFSVSAFAKKKELPVKVEEMVLEPALTEIKAEDEREFVVKGGSPPYVFKTSAGFIRYKDNTATYYSPNRPGRASVSVEDARGVKKAIVMDVLADVSVGDAGGN